MIGRPTVFLAIDRFGWAFHNIALQMVRYLGSEFDFKIIPYCDITSGSTADAVVAFWWNSVPLLRAKVQCRKLICTVYDGYSWATHNRGGVLLKQSLAQCDALAVANEPFLASLRARFPQEVQPLPSYLVEDGVDTSLFSYRPIPPDFRAGWCGNSFAAKQAAGIQDLKGVGTIKRACDLAGVPLEFADASDGGLRTHKEMPDWYSRISVLLHLSSLEGTPNPLLEAMACGRPVIITDVGLVPRIVSHGLNGFITPRNVDSVVQYLNAIKKMDLTRMGRSARMGAECHDWAIKILYWRACLRSVLDA